MKLQKVPAEGSQSCSHLEMISHTNRSAAQSRAISDVAKELARIGDEMVKSRDHTAFGTLLREYARIGTALAHCLRGAIEIVILNW